MPPGAMGIRNRFWAEPVHPLKQLSYFERLRDEGLLWEVTQRPGDVVFVPSDWVHATLNIGETVAIAQEFGMPNKWLSHQPISSVLYECLGEF